MTGKELQKAIVQLGTTLGWKMAHFPSVPVKYPGQPVRWMTPAQGGGKGWPDIFGVRERPIAIEVKAKGDRLHGDQPVWHSALRTAGIPVFVWGPDEWGEGGPIETELKRRQRLYAPMVAA